MKDVRPTPDSTYVDFKQFVKDNQFTISAFREEFNRTYVDSKCEFYFCIDGVSTETQLSNVDWSADDPAFTVTTTSTTPKM